jgi:alkylated DNA repair dioxygenase AlkB
VATGRTELRDGGWLFYTENFLAGPEADELLKQLQTEVEWRQERIYGRPVPRLNAWFADPGVPYAYSGLRFLGSGWPEWLLDTKHRVEAAAGTAFNSLLLNRYRNGQDSIGFHSDAEPELGPEPIVATLSLGAVRKLVLKHRGRNEVYTCPLAHGSLLVLGGNSQHEWVHGVPKTQTAVGERISLTYREIHRTIFC